jgi:AcrR family transcriptional regulator
MSTQAAKHLPRRLPFEQRHVQLLDLAEALFVERGYAAVSMEDIARAAGMKRPVAYQHFKTKEGAYLACVERARTAYQERLLRSIDPQAAPMDQLLAGGESFFAMLEEDPGRWQLLFGSNAVLPGQANDDLAALRFATIEQIHLLIAAAAPLAPAERIEACAHAVSGAIERLGHWWITRPDIPRARIVEHFRDIAWDGLRPYIS